MQACTKKKRTILGVYDGREEAEDRATMSTQNQWMISGRRKENSARAKSFLI